MDCPALHAWVEQKKRTGMVITDQLTAQIAGRYLKQIIEEGYDARREMYTMSVPEVLEHLDAVVAEAKAQGHMPALPAGIEATSRLPASRLSLEADWLFLLRPRSPESCPVP